MIGSPFYYDVLFDDGPGDVVFHDCMWSGICTCCIQLLHQDSYQFANESPDLKLEDSHCRTQINHHGAALATSATSTSAVASLTSTTSASSHLNQHLQQQQQQQQQQHHHHHQQAQLITNSVADSPAAVAQARLHEASVQYIGGHHNGRTCPDDSSSSSITTSSASASRIASCLTSPDASSSSSASSPAPANGAHSSSLSSPTCNSSSQSASPKPIRRREHNDSERKRRDHLRNAFNVLRDQVPRFKTISKKPPRIQILHEATKYVQIVMKEAEELERRLAEERAKHELNMKLSMK